MQGLSPAHVARESKANMFSNGRRGFAAFGNLGRHFLCPKKMDFETAHLPAVPLDHFFKALNEVATQNILNRPGHLLPKVLTHRSRSR